ncbi:MAG: hypothetical protein E6I58_09425 [Chloroflexi bacterium]|nr:MAG: hypothetical protein E6I58_09425 [Chloroflexota bacterium]
MKGLVVAISLMVAMFATSTAAMASEGAATQYKASFQAPMLDGGCVSIKDSEICTVTGDTSGLVAGTYVGNPTANVPPFGEVPWFSDFDGVTATRFKAIIVENPDGTFTQHILAYYN